MIFWIIAGSLTVCVVAGLLLPLLRRPRPGIDRSAYDMTVYRDQERSRPKVFLRFWNSIMQAPYVIMRDQGNPSAHHRVQR